MKTIQPRQADQVTLEELRTGYVTPDGVVLSKNMFNHTFTVPLGEVEVDLEDQRIPVLCQITQPMLEATREAVREQRSARHRGMP